MINNIFVLNHLIQRETKQGGKDDKVYILFADLKIAFNNVDKKILWEELKRGEVEESLIRRMEEIYGKTEVVIRTSHRGIQNEERRETRLCDESTPF